MGEDDSLLQSTLTAVKESPSSSVLLATSVSNNPLVANIDVDTDVVIASHQAAVGDEELLKNDDVTTHDETITDETIM